MNKIKTILMTVMMLIILGSLFSGCGNHNSGDSVEYDSEEDFMILDEGENDSADTKNSKDRSSGNTNAKTGSDKKSSSSKEPEASDPSTAPSVTKKPSEHSGASSGSGDGNELPFVPAGDASGDKNSSGNSDQSSDPIHPSDLDD